MQRLLTYSQCVPRANPSMSQCEMRMSSALFASLLCPFSNSQPPITTSFGNLISSHPSSDYTMTFLVQSAELWNYVCPSPVSWNSNICKGFNPTSHNMIEQHVFIRFRRSTEWRIGTDGDGDESSGGLTTSGPKYRKFFFLKTFQTSNCIFGLSIKSCRGDPPPLGHTIGKIFL